MPQIVDTTIRLLSQEPLAGKLPTGEVLRIAEILDTRRLRLPRGLGRRRLRLGGPARRREPVGADPRDRRAHDDAARPRAPRPVPRRLATRLRRHRAPLRLLRGRQRDRHLPAARPAQRRLEPASRRARRSSPRARSSTSASSTAPAATGEIDALVERREADARARRDARDPQRPDRRAAAAPHRGARRAHRRGDGPAGRPLRPGRRRARGSLNARRRDARRRRPDRDRGLSARADAPPRLGRVARRCAPRARPRDRRRHGAAVGGLPTSSTSTSATSPSRPSRRASPSARPSTTCPPGLVAALDVHLRAHAAGDRLLDTLTEVVRIRAESGWPPLASPIGQILASQALLNVLSARRYGTVLDEFRMLVEGAYGDDAGADRGVRHAGGRARHRQRRRPRRGSAERRGRARSGGGARSERGGPRPARDVRPGGRDAAAVDPPAPLARDVAAARRRRRDAGRADPRARQDRAGVRRRRDRDRGRGHARLGAARRRGRRRRARRSRRSPRAPRPTSRAAGPRDDARRVADGRRLLPVVVSREPRVRRGRRRRHASARRCACSRR